MIQAYHEIRNTRNNDKNIPDLRTAAFVTAIDKIATAYMALGIFP